MDGCTKGVLSVKAFSAGAFVGACASLISFSGLMVVGSTGVLNAILGDAQGGMGLMFAAIIMGCISILGGAVVGLLAANNRKPIGFISASVLGGGSACLSLLILALDDLDLLLNSITWLIVLYTVVVGSLTGIWAAALGKRIGSKSQQMSDNISE